MDPEKGCSRAIKITPAFSVTCLGDIFRPSFIMPFLDKVCKRLKDLFNCETNDKYKIITDLSWVEKIVDFACFPINRMIETVLV